MSTNRVKDLLCAALPLIDLAIAEDIDAGDATSEATLGPQTRLRGTILAKASGVIAGLPIACAVFKRVNPRIQFTAHLTDGQEVVPDPYL